MSVVRERSGSGVSLTRPVGLAERCASQKKEKRVKRLVYFWVLCSKIRPSWPRPYPAGPDSALGMAIPRDLSEIQARRGI